MKTKLLFTVSLGFFSLCTAAQGWEWGDVVLDAAGENVCTDPSGKVYLTGVYYDTTSIGPFVLNHTPSNGSGGDFFLAKYDENGTVLWVKNSSQVGNEEGKAISADVFSNIYVIGDFSSHIISFDNITLVNDSSGIEQFESTFVVKYDSGGNALWAKKFRSPGKNISNDSFGNVYFTANDSIFKYDTNGNEIWKTRTDAGLGLSTDANGNSYIIGGALIVDTIILNASNFIARFNANGKVVWLKEIMGGWEQSVSADAFGNVYSTGYFYSSITFDSITLQNNDNVNRLYLVKYDSTGTVQWAKQSSDSGWAKGASVSANGLGYVYTAGTFSGTVKFDSISLTEYGEVFIAKYDSSGNAVLAKNSNGYKLGQVFATWADGNGNAYVTGWSDSDTCNFGGDTLFGKGLFIAKVNSYPLSVEEKNFISGYDMVIYPNPACSSVTITAEGGDEIRVFDVTGRKIRTIQNFQSSVNFSTDEIANGIYFLTLCNKGQFMGGEKLVIVK